MVRGVRGATTVESNTAEAIREASRRLLSTIVDRNRIELEEIVSVFFTTTKDLDVETPAFGARQMGWTSIPLFCMQEMEVSDGLPKCIRVLVHVNTEKLQDEIRHVYLDGAVVLRPDIAEGG
ncbi:MAG: chorismate mutase [Gemmatimonadota bacterium]|nr:chorismate mutase [Gemmatimonadota bacterium]MDE2847813.1 chorismate mutase [Gemmatimonadota bacterium]